MFPALVDPQHFADLARFKQQPQVAAIQSDQEGGAPIVRQIAGIAIVPVAGSTVHRNGAIHPTDGTTSYEGLQIQIGMALDHPDVRGILLDINSGGGDVSGLFDLVDMIYEGRSQKPIWASIDEAGASAAYALASAAHRVVTPRTGLAGSIGVVLGHVDMSGALEKEGLAVTLIHAGASKVDGNQFEPLSPEVKARLQAEVDDLYGLFVRTVARNRNMSESAVRGTQARVFMGDKAVQAKLVDQVMPSHDVLQTFHEHLQQPRSNAKKSKAVAASAQPQPTARASFAAVASRIYGS